MIERLHRFKETINADLPRGSLYNSQTRGSDN
jgi:hypothetical protein